MAEPLGAAADLSRLEPGRNGARQPSLCAAPCQGRAGATAQVLHPRHVPLPVRRGAARGPPGRLHRHRHPRPLPPRAAATTSCIRWAGTPSACPPSNTPSRPASIRARPPSRTSPPSSARSSRSASATTGAARSTPPTREYFKWTQWIFLQLYNSWFNPADQQGRADRRPSLTRPNCSAGAGVPTRRTGSSSAAPIATPSAWPTSPKPRSGGASSSAPCSPTKKSWTARARSAASRSCASRCANGCCASPPTPSACCRTWTPSTGAIRSRKCSATGSAAAKARRWTFRDAPDSHREVIRVFTTRPDTLFGATYMVLAPEHKLVDAITTPAQRQAGRSLQGRGRQEERPRTHRAGQGEDRRLHRRLRHQPGQRGEDSDLDRRLRAHQLRHRRDHGRAGPRHARLRVRHQVQPAHRPGRRTAGRHGLARLRRRRRLGQLRQRRDLDQRPAHARGQAQDHRLAGVQGPGQEDHQLQAARLALQPPALLGRAVPDRLEDRAGRRSRITKPCPNRPCRCCRRRSTTTSPPPTASRRWRARRTG